jgi:hypothetical protein
MSLKLIGVEKAGDLENERIALRAMAAVADIGKYVVLRARKSPDGRVFSGPIPDAYWFDSIPVKIGDWVVLYTKSGARSQKTTPDGNTSHFFYWGQNSPLWAPEFKPAVVLAIGWEWPS